MLKVRLALAVGLAVMLAALAVVLSRSPPILAGTNGVAGRLLVTHLKRGGRVGCQPGGTLPRGTDAIRVSLSANAGPRVSLRVLAGSRVVTEGTRAAGWGVTETVTVPVRRVAAATGASSICVTLGALVEPLQVNKVLVRTPAGRHTARLRFEYLRPGPNSWLSLSAAVARHMGIGHAPSGTWLAYLVLAAMILVSGIASRLVLREAAIHTSIGVPGGAAPGDGGPRPRAIPRAAWTCALVAALSAACWSLITPPFQIPDEPSHFAYAQLLAEAGRLPTSTGGPLSPEEEAVLQDLHQLAVQWHPEVQTISTPSERRLLAEDLSLHISRVGSGGIGVAASEPPGYPALETIPYRLGAAGTLLDRLELMRLLSALLAGVAALFVFLFIRESLPGAPWAWTVGGLAVALLPLLGSTCGGVTPDAMLSAVCAAIFYCLARAFRRGLTRELAIVVGALTAVGLLTKLSFIGVAPGVLLGLIASAFLGPRSKSSGGDLAARRPKRVAGALALAIALASSPAFAYVLRNLLEHHPTLEVVSGTIQDLRGHSPLDVISYTWQLYLPRLPGMLDYFPGLSTTRQLWFAHAVGDYGWLDTSFPVWVNNLALAPAGLMAILGLRSALAHRTMLRARLPEILAYLAISAGLTTLIGAVGYAVRVNEGAAYFQPRYLLPLLPLAGAFLAMAARGAGRRWGPAAGALIVLVFLAHDVFSQLQVVARYYG